MPAFLVPQVLSLQEMLKRVTADNGQVCTADAAVYLLLPSDSASFDGCIEAQYTRGRIRCIHPENGRVCFVNTVCCNQNPLLHHFAQMCPQLLQAKAARAVIAGDVSAVQAALDSGADPGACNGYGDTALHVAAKRGHAEVVRQLLAAGADLAARNQTGDTVLHYAADNGRAEVVQHLLAAGADLAAHNEDGYTARVSATVSGHVAVAQQLLDAAGADPVSHIA